MIKSYSLIKDSETHNLNSKVKKKIDLNFLGEIEKGKVYYSSLLSKLFLVDSEKELEEIKNRKHSIPDSFSIGPYSKIVLFPTTVCNFNCEYCLSSAKGEGTNLDPKIAKKAIDFFIESKNLEKVSVKFIGGGEPTQNFSLIKETTEYLKEKDIPSNIGLQTNGLIDDKKRKWIAKNLDGICISCDGPSYIQNKQRPLANGGKTSNQVEESIKYFVEQDISISVRSTITLFSQTKQKEIVDYFYRLGIKEIDFLNVLKMGRGEKQSNKYNKTPDRKISIENFLKAKDYADKIGTELKCPFFPIYKRRNTFCDCSIPSFMITADGYVSACEDFSLGKKYEKAPMIYGKFDKKKNKFVFDKGKLDRLQNRKICNMDKCKDCFLKWNCGGGCHSLAYRKNNDIYSPFRDNCKWIKGSSKKHLMNLAKNKF